MPRLIARSMVSFGMFAAFASETALRSRAFESTSPLPPVRVATVISLIILVKILPRLASSAPFLCLIVCHLECPDMLFYRFLWIIRVGMNTLPIGRVFAFDITKLKIYHARFLHSKPRLFQQP